MPMQNSGSSCVQKKKVNTALLFYLMYLIVYVNLLFRNVTYFEQMRLIFFIYTYVLQYGTEYTNPKGACLF